MKTTKSKCNLYECKGPGCQSYGSLNSLNYDRCAYQKQLYESTAPLSYRLYEGAHESCDKCIYDRFWRPFDLVDVESELKNITRPNSKCSSFKYNPLCKNSKSCLSTFDPKVPVVHNTLCPVVFNNIKKMTHPGYVVPNDNICKKN